MTEAAERDAADATWRGLTGPQRELLLSTSGGAPIETGLRVEYPLIADGLLRVGDGSELIVTHAGRMLIARRSHP